MQIVPQGMLHGVNYIPDSVITQNFAPIQAKYSQLHTEIILSF